MNRQVLLLSVLGVVVLLVAFFFLLWQPKADELTAINEDIDVAVAEQANLEARIRDLEAIRDRVPELEAELAAVDAVVPRDAALPSALRQLQLAADDSGVDLRTVSPGRPVAIGGEEAAVPELAEITLTVAIDGGYFQIVDFLRRVADPAITPRAISWSNATVTPGEYPTLSVSLSGQMFAVIPEALPAPGEDEADVVVETDDTTVVVEDEEAAA